MYASETKIKSQFVEAEENIKQAYTGKQGQTEKKVKNINWEKIKYICKSKLKVVKHLMLIKLLSFGDSFVCLQHHL